MESIFFTNIVFQKHYEDSIKILISYGKKWLRDANLYEEKYDLLMGILDYNYLDPNNTFYISKTLPRMLELHLTILQQNIQLRFYNVKQYGDYINKDFTSFDSVEILICGPYFHPLFEIDKSYHGISCWIRRDYLREL